MNKEHFELAAVLLAFGVLAFWWWRQHHTRERFAVTLKNMAEPGRDEIGGQGIEYWLSLLNQVNQDATHRLVAGPTTVLVFKGEAFFFVDGTIIFPVYGHPCASYRSKELFFLVAVGQSAVRLLSEQEQLFRQIAGTKELAAFSVYRWSDFIFMLTTERRGIRNSDSMKERSSWCYTRCSSPNSGDTIQNS